jgi:hypothetical protein
MTINKKIGEDTALWFLKFNKSEEFWVFISWSAPMDIFQLRG